MHLNPEWVIEGDHTMEGGMKALGHLATLQSRPTAVMCSNDVTAVGVMREAFDLGITVPHDMSVVGFDDVRLAQFVIPPLTTVRMSQTELANLAFKALLAEVERDALSPTGTEYVLETDLVLRKSTALAPSPANS